MSQQRYQLPEGRLSYLPISIQKFIKTNNTECYKSKNESQFIKENYPCILRYGVNNDVNKTFLSCIATVLGNKDYDTADKLQKYLAKIITLDDFIKYQNGDLITIFKSNDVKQQDIFSSKYKETKFYKNIIKRGEVEAESEGGVESEYNDSEIIYSNVINAFENFKQFLVSDTYIDYKYIWDFICMPNNKLFKDGINLVIFKIENSDITDNVDIVCPSNTYSKFKYNTKRQFVFLIQENNYFEPICEYIDDVGEKKLAKPAKPAKPAKQAKGEEAEKILPTKNFRFDINTKGLYNFKVVAELIVQSSSKCNPETVINTNEFQSNKTLDKIENILKENGLEIKKQIINSEGKAMAVISTDNIYIPVYPSSVNNAYPYELYNLRDAEYKLSYTHTYKLLQDIAIKTNNKLLCKPLRKIIENEYIVGILTETNQFVPVIPSEDTIKDELTELRGTDYVIADRKIATSDDKDDEMKEYTNKIKVETNLFSIFRNTIRLHLNNPKNRKGRDDIERIINDIMTPYMFKLDRTKLKLEEIMGDTVEFVEFDSKDINSITENLKENTCFSSGDREDNCKLWFPKYHLIHKDSDRDQDSDNEIIYYGRIADELIRYGHIRSFLLKPDIHTSFDTISYDLRDNEILLLETILVNNYFTDIDVSNKNEYAKNNTYDSTNPLNVRLPPTNITVNTGRTAITEKSKTPRQDTTHRSKITSKTKVTPKSTTTSTPETTTSRPRGRPATKHGKVKVTEKVRPSVGETPPTVGETQPSVGETPPTVGETQPSVGETQPSVGETQPSVGTTDGSSSLLEYIAKIPKDCAKTNVISKIPDSWSVRYGFNIREYKNLKIDGITTDIKIGSNKSSNSNKDVQDWVKMKSLCGFYLIQLIISQYHLDIFKGKTQEMKLLEN